MINISRKYVHDKGNGSTFHEIEGSEPLYLFKKTYLKTIKYSNTIIPRAIR
jgi:hypothetical protein